jgi:hypothetical protein
VDGVVRVQKAAQPHHNDDVGQMAYAAESFSASLHMTTTRHCEIGDAAHTTQGVHARIRPSDQTGSMLVIDAANVVGSRPSTAWWRDRAGAAKAFVDEVSAALVAGHLVPPVVVVLEGKARSGVPMGSIGGITVVHADSSGDDALVDVVTQATDHAVTLVTADRELRGRAEAASAEVVGPAWLLDRLP